MSRWGLLRRNLGFHWRANLAVLLGVAIGTAVLTGSLLVGDSLRGSLRDLTLKRLGAIDLALVSDRFFPANLADRLKSAARTLVGDAVPAIMLRGTVLVRNADGSLRSRAGQVQVVGVDERFAPLMGCSWDDLGTEVILNVPLAAELVLGRGDLVEIRFDRSSSVPSDSVINQRNQAEGLLLEQSKIRDIVPVDLSGNCPVGRFSLSAEQAEPRLAFVQLRRLQNRLARDGDQPPGSANTLLVTRPQPAQGSQESELISTALREIATLEDAGLVLRMDATKKRYLSLESRRMLLEPQVAARVLQLASERHWTATPTLTYLANQIVMAPDFAAGITGALGGLLGQRDPCALAMLARAGSAYTPYATVAGLDPSAAPPFGPLLLASGQPAPALRDDEVLVSDFVARDLWPFGGWERAIGKPCVRLSYFVEGSEHQLQERSVTLKLAGVVPVSGYAADPSLTPEFPGLRGARIADWRPPFPRRQWHPEWIREADEAFYRTHRVTPKAYVSPELAKKIWSSQYGDATSIRIAAGNKPLSDLEREVRAALNAALPPESLGMVLQPIKSQGLAATNSGTAQMFGWLFVGFSLFIIIAALLLVALLFRLTLEQRASEWGLLFALGYPLRMVRWFALVEGLLIAGLGAGLGLLVAVVYTVALIWFLRGNWQSALDSSFLRFHIARRDLSVGVLPYPSLIVGFVVSFLIAGLCIVINLRGLARLAPAGLTGGSAQLGESGAQSNRWTMWVSTLSLLGAIILAGATYLVPKRQSAGLFFGSGFLLLLAGLAAGRAWLRQRAKSRPMGTGPLAVAWLGTSYAGRNPTRSLLTAGLLATGTFLVIAVQAFRQAPVEVTALKSGTGGFQWFVQSDVALPFVPQNAMAWNSLAESTGASESARVPFPTGARIYGLRLRGGDDVSCRNLYQPGQPRLLGVPPNFVERGGFQFGVLAQATEEEKANPWTLLSRNLPDAIPVVADDHTAEWVLQKSVGDAWDIEDEQGRPVKVRLVGVLTGSLFQSELLMNEANFRRLYPSSGYHVLLIESDESRPEAARGALDLTFGEALGLTFESASARLAAFQAVENTYLTTFQSLGGLGLLLGSLGVGVVMLRNLNERRGEWALFRAMGFSRKALTILALAENGLMVLLGLAIGLSAAAVAVAPNLMGHATRLPWLSITLLVASIVVIGILSGCAALRSALRAPLLAALNRG